MNLNLCIYCKKILIHLILISSLLVNCSQRAQEPVIHTRFQKDKLEEIARLSKLIKQDKNNALLLMQRGRAKLFSAIRDIEKDAIGDLNSALELNPNLTKAYFIRAVYHRRHGTQQAQMNDLKSAVQHNQSNPSAHYKLGLYYYKNSNNTLALKHFDQTILYDPMMHGAHYLEGLIFKNMGNFKEAISHFDDALEIKPGWAVYHFHRGETHELAGDYNKALNDFNAVLIHDQNQFGNLSEDAKKHIKTLETTLNEAIANPH